MAKFLGYETISLDKLIPFPGNARRGDVEKLRTSIRAHDQYRSLVVRRTPGGDVILAGNHTAQALIAEGRGTARCEVVECTESDAIKINLMDNRSGDDATNDDEALAALLTELDGDYDGSGFTFDEHQDLLALLGHFEGGDAVPGLDELANELGEPRDDELWPVLRFKVPPNVRDDFYTVTDPCGEFDDVHRFMYLVKKAQAAG